MGATVGITFNLKRDFPRACGNGGCAEDQAAECEEQETVDSLAASLGRQCDRVLLFPHQPDLLERLDEARPDMVFNIAEGWVGRNRESLIPALLELLGIPFTGSDALTLGIALDKAMAKRVVSTAGIRTPRYCKINTVEDLSRVDLAFPMFVKPNCEGSSKGIRNSSRVNTPEELAAKVQWVLSTYHQPALVEEFLPGREFTVGIIGNGKPHVLPIMEVCPGDREAADHSFVYSYETKSGNLERFKVPAPIPDTLARELSDMAVAAFEAMECRDVSRVDFRLDEAGKPYFLEINPLPGMSRVSLLPLQARAAGMAFDELVRWILTSAWARYYH
ncbi:MAG: ATP-grasp domain-containing protein [Firmicutes bacterium]|jgi:D-alanine-D-alanine ligase|nr:ATP-grasp domain-containing protein [Bacillota bacterium]